MPNVHSDPSQLDKVTFPILGLLGEFFIFIQFSMEHFVSKEYGPDQMPHSALSDLYLHYLPMSNEKDARLI